MSPSKKRTLFNGTLALALAALAFCPALPTGHAQTSQSDEINKHTLKVSTEIEEYLRKTGKTRVTVIIQMGGQPTPQLISYLSRVGVRLKGQYAMLGSFAVEVPAGMVGALANFTEIKSVSRDRELVT